MSEVSASPTHGYNLALECLKVHLQIHGHRDSPKERELHDKIDVLDNVNKNIRTISNLMSALTHEQKLYKKADFSSNGEVKKWIDELYALNPKIFESGNEKSSDYDPNARYIFKDEESIKVVTQALDAETKMQSADANKILMEIQHAYSDRGDLMKMAQEGVKQDSEHLRSLVNALKPH
jgi:hypothetical protein